MKRLGIFIFYDQDGIVDQTEEYLLHSLLDILDRMIIVVNGKITDESLFQTMNQYTKEIVCRENKGYDGGAYQDLFLHYLNREEVQQFDEIVLLNNTFYGPFYSWNQVFGKMERFPVDFWGLTKHLEFYSPMLKRHMNEFIQSYFLVLERDCWNQMNSGSSGNQ